MDGGGNVEGVLEHLAGGGVDHGPLEIKSASVFDTQGVHSVFPEPGLIEIGVGVKLHKRTRVGVSEGTQEMKMILLLRIQYVSQLLQLDEKGDWVWNSYRLPSPPPRSYSTS